MNDRPAPMGHSLWETITLQQCVKKTDLSFSIQNRPKIAYKRQPPVYDAKVRPELEGK